MKLRQVFPFILLAFLMSCLSKSEKQQVSPDYAQFIDPFICTADDHGQTDVAAAVPFGMVKPCPDTNPIGHSGYDFNSTEILGFSHTRFSGVGCRGVGGNIRVLPFSGTDSVPLKQTYIKSSEIAIPGYYSVLLSQNIKAELTATNQVAFHKYTFPASTKSGFSVDLASSFVAHISEYHQIDAQGILSGKIESVNVCKIGKYSFFYALYIDKNNVHIEEENSKLIYRFSTTENEEVRVWCALSVVGEEQAKKKLRQQMKLPFVEVKNTAYTKWNDLMSTIVVETDDVRAKRLFYTHLYHATQSPFLISEEDGSYRGSDGKLYEGQNKKHYHGWSIWDTFRSKLPLLSFLFPDTYTDMMASLGELYKQGKPNWATQTEPFITIRTEHSMAILLDAHRKGLLPFLLDEIYPQLKAEEDSLPFKSPDNVLESSYDLWALSQIAKELGYEDDARAYLNKAMNYKPLWEEKFLHMGETADVMHGDGLYEGTLWQYRWFVPFDIEGIQSLVGGKAVFEQQLDYFFENELFNMGNQPDIQVPFLYAYTNSPWKTQRIINQLLNEVTNNWYGTHDKWEKPLTRRIFEDSPEGFIKEMDDDAGTMSAWYVWSSMGFFPVFPGSTQMVITTPQFDKIELNLPGGKIQIKTIKLSDKAIYIQEVRIDGVEHNSCFIDFNRLKQVKQIEFILDANPDENWETGVLQMY